MTRSVVCGHSVCQQHTECLFHRAMSPQERGEAITRARAAYERIKAMPHADAATLGSARDLLAATYSRGRAFSLWECVQGIEDLAVRLDPTISADHTALRPPNNT